MNLDINNYPGSKGGSGVKEWIINKIPRGYEFIEMCTGSGIISETLIALNACLKKYYLHEIDKSVGNQLELKFIGCRGLRVFNSNSIEYYENMLKTDPCYEESVFYFDPPYIRDTRKSTRDLYNHEWTLDDHYKMLVLVKKLDKAGASVIISHYPNDLYDAMLPDWSTDTMETRTRGGNATEKLWWNYDITKTLLATTAYVGENNTDRQRVKRKKERWAQKLAALPLHEQQAIYEHISKQLRYQV